MGKDKADSAAKPQTDATPEVVTPEGVMEKLRAAMGADPFATDRKTAVIRSVGSGLNEAIKRATTAHAHAATLDAVVVDLAQEALVALSEVNNPVAATSDAPKKRGRPPGSTNKPKDDTPSATTPAPDSAAANALAD